MTTKIATYEDWATLLELAEAGDHIAQYEVASYYDSGLVIMETEIVEENQSMAFKWYDKAYKNGNEEAITRMADFLSEGIYCQQNIELAIQLYQRGIENGCSVSAHNLAIIYRDKQDYKRAFELHEISQNLGQSNSFPLALCYYFGIGTEKNVEMSFEIFNKISEDKAGFISSQYEIDEANYFLAKIYLDGEIVERSITRARAFLTLANADDDHRSAQELLLIIDKKN